MVKLFQMSPKRRVAKSSWEVRFAWKMTYSEELLELCFEVVLDLLLLGELEDLLLVKDDENDKVLLGVEETEEELDFDVDKVLDCLILDELREVLN